MKRKRKIKQPETIGQRAGRLKDVRYIVRCTFWKRKETKANARYSKRKAVYTLVSKVAIRKMKVVSSLNEIREFATSQFETFKDKKQFKEFTINMQAFKGKTARSKNRLFLKPNQESTKAAKGRNVGRRYTKKQFKQYLERLITNVFLAAKHEDFSPTVKTSKRPVQKPLTKKEKKLQYGRRVMAEASQKSPLVKGFLEREEQKRQREEKSIQRKGGKTLAQGIRKIEQRQKRRKKKR